MHATTVIDINIQQMTSLNAFPAQLVFISAYINIHNDNTIQADKN